MTRFTKIFFKEMEKLDYIYFVDRSEKGFKCQLKYIDENQIIQYDKQDFVGWSQIEQNGIKSG